MNSHPLTVVAATVLLSAVPAPATTQSRPDFSGVWNVASQPGGGRGGAQATPELGSGWGPSFFLVQRADSLIVERGFFDPGDLQPPLKFRYALTGAETTNTVLMGRGFQRHTATARWDGDRLVITARYTDGQADRGRGVTSEVRYTLSYQPSPREAHPPQLVVETWREGALGGAPTTSRTVYIRG